MKDIIYGAKHVGLFDSIYITIVSISIVFIILILISIMLSFFKYIPKDELEEKKAPKKTLKNNKENKFNISDLNDEEKLIASLISIIICSEEENSENIKLKSIKRIS